MNKYRKRTNKLPEKAPIKVSKKVPVEVAIKV